MILVLFGGCSRSDGSSTSELTSIEDVNKSVVADSNTTSDDNVTTENSDDIDVTTDVNTTERSADGDVSVDENAIVDNSDEVNTTTNENTTVDGHDVVNAVTDVNSTEETSNDINTTVTENTTENSDDVNVAVDENVTTESPDDLNATEENATVSTDINASLPTTPSTLKSIQLTLTDNRLNVGTQTTVKAIAAYADRSSKDVTNEVVWISSDADALTITDHKLQTKKETNIILKAKLNSITSNAVALEIYRSINGHILPPEPDPKINNATLLGIDSNNNDVRDDVERWIYKKYKDKHPIYIDIAMQAGRAYKQVLETPERAKEIRETVNAPYFCGSYYENYAKFLNESVLVHERIDSPVNSKYFNTKERSDVYWQYDTLLSGGSYPLPKIRKMKSFCDFNTSKYEE